MKKSPDGIILAKGKTRINLLELPLKKTEETISFLPCSECNIGQMHKTQAAYFTWMGDELISVPDFPAWVCDICGRREYDTQALNQLSMLLGPNDGGSGLNKPTRIHRKTDIKPKGIQPASPK